MLTAIRLFVLLIVASLSTMATNDAKLFQIQHFSIKTTWIACAPPLNITSNGEENFSAIPILPGWGHHHYSISTRMDSSQLYFDQGLSMYYSYHPNEAMASFQESARMDPHCAMAYWGQALSMGPTYNGAGYSSPEEIRPVLDKLKSGLLSPSAKEKDLIAAMLRRFESFDNNTPRYDMDLRYAKSMKMLIEKYPDDIEIKAIYVDAVMLEHAWDFWDKDGNPKQWTLELLDLCRQILVKEPLHPGALHYQIHLSEASRHPEIALHSAEVLRAAMPGVAHMMHMTSHVYERNGLYKEAIGVNELAINNSDNYSRLGGQGFGGGGNLHYRAVETVAAMNAGMYSKAISLAKICSHAFSDGSTAYVAQYILLPTFVDLRLGKWNEILQSSTGGSASTYLMIMDEFAKGMASVRMHDISFAKKMDDRMIANSFDPGLYTEGLMLHDTPIKAVHVAHNLLKAEIFAEEKNMDSALESFRAAIQAEDDMIFFQPRNWLIPARQYFGAFLLKTGKIEEARHCYEEDLKRNPGNGWSQIGIYQCLMKKADFAKAEFYKKQFNKVFAMAESMPLASVY